MDPVHVADICLLVGGPLIFAVLMLWATLTPGNPLVGLIIGWAAVSLWAAIDAIAIYQKLKRP